MTMAPPIQQASMTIISGRTQLCDCGCGEMIDRRGGRRYVNDRHRQRAYRRRLSQRLRDAGLPDRLNLQVAEGTQSRHGDARKPRRQRKTELRISYRKAVEVIARELHRHELVRPRTEEAAWVAAEVWLNEVLTDRQRVALKEQR